MVSGSFTTVAVLIMKIATALTVTGALTHAVHYYHEYQPTTNKRGRGRHNVDSPNEDLRARARANKQE